MVNRLSILSHALAATNQLSANPATTPVASASGFRAPSACDRSKRDIAVQRLPHSAYNALRHTETWLVLSLSNRERSQPPQRCVSVRPAICAIRVKLGRPDVAMPRIAPLTALQMVSDDARSLQWLG